jgi:hypothetical protein
MLSLFLLLGASNLKPHQEIVLQTAGRMLVTEPPQIKRLVDGSFLISSVSEFFHFAPDGSLLLRAGRKGQGPGEFQYIPNTVFTGNSYWVIDGMRLDMTMMDQQGGYLKRVKPYHRDVYCFQNANVVVLGGGYRQLAKERKPQLQLADLSPDFQLKGSPFHLLPEIVPDVSYQYTYPLLCLAEDQLFVGCMLEPVIYRYRLKDQAFAGKLQIHLPGFVLATDVQPMPKSDTPDSRKKFYAWEDSFSRVSWISASSRGFWVSYEMPSTTSRDFFGHSRETRLLLIGPDGKPKSEPWITNHVFLGCSGDDLFLFQYWDEDRDAKPTYRIQVLRFAE